MTVVRPRPSTSFATSAGDRSCRLSERSSDSGGDPPAVAGSGSPPRSRAFTAPSSSIHAMISLSQPGLSRLVRPRGDPRNAAQPRTAAARPAGSADPEPAGGADDAHQPPHLVRHAVKDEHTACCCSTRDRSSASARRPPASMKVSPAEVQDQLPQVAPPDQLAHPGGEPRHGSDVQLADDGDRHRLPRPEAPWPRIRRAVPGPTRSKWSFGTPVSTARMGGLVTLLGKMPYLRWNFLLIPELSYAFPAVTVARTSKIRSGPGRNGRNTTTGDLNLAKAHTHIARWASSVRAEACRRWGLDLEGRAWIRQAVRACGRQSVPAPIARLAGVAEARDHGLRRTARRRRHWAVGRARRRATRATARQRASGGGA